MTELECTKAIAIEVTLGGEECDSLRSGLLELAGLTSFPSQDLLH